MDSPESSKPTTTESARAQESPFSSYASNLSPIEPIKVRRVSQGFPGLSSPPLVFTSPQPNPLTQPSPTKRPLLPRLSSAKSSGKEEGCKDSITSLHRSGEFDTNDQPSSGLMTCMGKGLDSNDPADDQTNSSRGCLDCYLADNLDSVDSNNPTNPCLERSNEYAHLRGSAAEKGKFIVNPQHKASTGENAPNVDKNDPVHEGNAVIERREVASNVNLGNGDIPVDQHPYNDPKPLAEDSLSIQHSDGFITKVQNAEVCQMDRFDHSSDSLVAGYKENKNSLENTGTALTELLMTKVQNTLGIVQQPGIRRRCLQFEDAQQKVMANRSAQSLSCRENLSGQLDTFRCSSEATKSRSSEIPSASFNKQQQVDMNLNMVYPGNSRNSTLEIPKPSGIGLHLNSVVNSIQVGSGGVLDIKSAQLGSFSIQGKNLVTSADSHLSDNSKSCSVLSITDSILAKSLDASHNSHSPIAAISASPVSTYKVEPQGNTLVYNPIENQTPLGNKRKTVTDNSGGTEEFNQSSFQKQRKKKSESEDGDGCKRCNCKKSKCLKLYCDCFAAGIYCAEPCACQECFNKPDYEDSVLVARQQIESRNPLAFAPKIVKRVIQPTLSSLGERTPSTPSSARHKRGCNCKKSMCLKKYCECYQANVGCSDGCRCEECKNVYGRKGGHGMINDVVSGQDSNEAKEGSLEKTGIESGTGLYNSDSCNPHNLTPTPLFQYSEHSKAASNTWFPQGKYLHPPQSDVSNLEPYMMSQRSAGDSHDHNMISEARNEMLDLASFDRQLDGNNTEEVNEFAPGCYKPANLGLLDVQPTTFEWPNNLKAQSFPGGGRFSLPGSHRWSGSPNTPMLQSSGTRMLQGTRSSGLYNLIQDESPEILKDNNSSLNAVKTSSPNKKRVSPPIRGLRELTSSSSAGVRTGRRFILKAVPSFPPLTPCVDSKSISLKTNDPEDCSDRRLP